jgi:hypothetical protein
MPYTIEKDGVYFYDTRLKGADHGSFQILSGNFARDASAVYAHRKRFADGDPATFEILVNPGTARPNSPATSVTSTGRIFPGSSPI